jgi:HIV-1 Vpr-binding protein
VEDVLTTGIVGKLMHYLRIQVIGESGSSGDVGAVLDNRSSTGAGSSRARDESRGRARPHIESSRNDDIRVSDRTSVEKVSIEQVNGTKDEEIAEDDKDGRSSVEPADLDLNSYDADEDGEERVGEDKRRRRDRREVKGRAGTGDLEETGRAEPSRRKNDNRDRGGGRGKGKGRTAEGMLEAEKIQGQAPARIGSFGDTPRSRKSLQDKINSKSENITDCGNNWNALPVNRALNGRDVDVAPAEEPEEDITAPCVMVGDVDIGGIIRKAQRAAEAEANNANAPLEAVTAAGDAAAELVRQAATEVSSYNHILRMLLLFV